MFCICITCNQLNSQFIAEISKLNVNKMSVTVKVQNKYGTHIHIIKYQN